MDSMRFMSVDAFTSALAAKSSVPGGGGAAALAGALGVALCAMVGNFTVGKKKYAAVEEDVRVMLDRANVLQEKFLSLIDADAAAFEPLSRAYAIPKDDPSREAVMASALCAACESPISVMRCCCEAIALLEEMFEKGSVMLVSDVGVGAELCKAALCSAHMNVLINTNSMSDFCARKRFEEEAAAQITEYLPRAERLSAAVRAALCKEETL